MFRRSQSAMFLYCYTPAIVHINTPPASIKSTKPSHRLHSHRVNNLQVHVLQLEAPNHHHTPASTSYPISKPHPSSPLSNHSINRRFNPPFQSLLALHPSNPSSASQIHHRHITLAELKDLVVRRFTHTVVVSLALRLSWERGRV